MQIKELFALLTAASLACTPKELIMQDYQKLENSLRINMPIEIKSDNADRTFYYILQIHQSGDKNKEVIDSQKRIYELVQYLANTRNIELVTFEGLSNHENEEYKPDCKDLTPKRSNFDSLLEENPDAPFFLYCSKQDFLIRGWERAHYEGLDEEWAETFKKMVEGNATEELFETAPIMTIERTRQSFESTFKQGDKLYKEGKIKSKESIILIGRLHKKSLLEDLAKGYFNSMGRVPNVYVYDLNK